ncbi:hypothetical protein BC941DRAFT_204721 [Chlamydoabsidia padenii]|nr:hypothetical protein BC941DRAFT_204721 [Chlamydoabsidia padenii]
MLYLIEFRQSTTQVHQKKADIVLTLTQLQSSEDIYSIQYIKKHQQVITYQVISSTGQFTTCKVDLGSSPVLVTRTPHSLKKSINNTLAELNELESSQINMDVYHEDINHQLISLNRILHTLQNASLKKKKSNSGEFDFKIVPVVKRAPITGQPQPCLRLTIQTKLLLDWTDWYLNIDMEHQRTTKQESDSYALDRPEYMVGKSILLPLNGFEHDEDATGAIQTWERDLELDPQQHPLPLNINVSICMNMDTSRAIDKDTPILEHLPISNNASIVYTFL